MNQILQNNRAKLSIIFFMTLLLSLSTISVFAGGKFCPYCGEEILPDARFCSYCGQELEGENLPKIRHYGIGIGYGFDILADDSLSLALCLDYVSDSGLGCQLNMAFYTTYSESVDSVFIFPMIRSTSSRKLPEFLHTLGLVCPIVGMNILIGQVILMSLKSGMGLFLSFVEE